MSNGINHSSGSSWNILLLAYTFSSGLGYFFAFSNSFSDAPIYLSSSSVASTPSNYQLSSATLHFLLVKIGAVSMNEHFLKAEFSEYSSFSEMKADYIYDFPFLLSLAFIF